jgi:hypothetical protein
VATIDVRKGPEGKVVYRARIRRKGYPTQTGTFPSRREAKKWITITEGAIFEQRHFPVKAPPNGHLEGSGSRLPT